MPIRSLFPSSALIRLCCSLRRPGVAAAVLLTAVVLLPAQTDTGTIRGYVYDASRAVLPGVTVTATYQGRGVARETLTSDVGEYVLSRVDPGLYTLRFELPGFASYVVQDLEVLVGETQNFSPEIVVAAEAIVVTAEANRTVIAHDKVQQSNHIDSASIEDLPINRRDYLDLALLTPGVVDSNYVADDRDFRIAPTPASGLGIGGGGGRGNTFTIDGLNNNYGTGAVRSSITQEAIQEFQINRNSFSAELGGAPGGAINIVTKGGTNEFRGSIFGVLRNRHFQARNYFDPSESAYTRAQSGGSFGGPILRDRTFFFAAYERLDRHESSFVPLLQDRSFLYELKPTQQALADLLTSPAAPPFLVPAAQELVQALKPGNHPHVVQLFESNSGVFPFSEERQQFIARIDHAVAPGHDLFFRGNWTGQNSQHTNFGSLVARSRGRNNDVNDFTVGLGYNWVIGPEWISETWLSAGYHDSGTFPTDPHGPAIDISGYGNFGRDFILPTRNVERMIQARQNFTYVHGSHTVKVGADIHPFYDSVRSETFFSGRFIFGEAVPLSSLIDSAFGSPISPLIKGLLIGAGEASTGGGRRRTHHLSPGLRSGPPHRLPAGLRESLLERVGTQLRILPGGFVACPPQVPADSGIALRTLSRVRFPPGQQQLRTADGIRLEP